MEHSSIVLEFGRDLTAEPEIKLWQAVLFRMMADLGMAVSGSTPPRGRNKFSDEYRNLVLDRRAAIHWFRFNSDDVRLVCDYAGADFQAVMRMVNGHIAENIDQWRAEEVERENMRPEDNPEYHALKSRRQRWYLSHKQRKANRGCAINESVSIV